MVFDSTFTMRLYILLFLLLSGCSTPCYLDDIDSLYADEYCDDIEQAC